MTVNVKYDIRWLGNAVLAFGAVAGVLITGFILLASLYIVFEFDAYTDWNQKYMQDIDITEDEFREGMSQVKMILLAGVFMWGCVAYMVWREVGRLNILPSISMK